MRTAIIIAISLVLMGPVIAFHPTHRDPASVVFGGYRRWWHPSYTTNFNGRLEAYFFLTNHTGRWLYTSDARGCIEVKTANGWTNYAEEIVREKVGTNMVNLLPYLIKTDGVPLSPHDTVSFTRLCPPGPVTWRLHVTYSVRPPDLWIFNSVSFILGLQHEKNKDAWSDEIPNTPADDSRAAGDRAAAATNAPVGWFQLAPE